MHFAWRAAAGRAAGQHWTSCGWFQEGFHPGRAFSIGKRVAWLVLFAVQKDAVRSEVGFT